MGARVRASDGTMQPKLTAGESAAIRSIKKRRREWAQQVDPVQRTIAAITALSENHHEPSTVFNYGSDVFLSAEIREKLDSALSWLKRFAEDSHIRTAMIKKIHAPKVRNFLAEITSALPSDGLPTEAIIASLKAQHADAIYRR